MNPQRAKRRNTEPRIWCFDASQGLYFRQIRKKAVTQTRERTTPLIIASSNQIRSHLNMFHKTIMIKLITKNFTNPGFTKLSRFLMGTELVFSHTLSIHMGMIFTKDSAHLNQIDIR